MHAYIKCFSFIIENNKKHEKYWKNMMKYKTDFHDNWSSVEESLESERKCLERKKVFYIFSNTYQLN